MTYSKRIAQPSDFSNILSLIDDGKKQMYETGITQWNDHYPNKKIIEEDIKNKRLYIYGTNYEAIVTIEKKEKVGFIQRLVVNSEYKGQGIARFVLSDLIYQEERRNEITQLRLCTNYSNIPIRKLLMELNFSPCDIYKKSNREQFGFFIEYSYLLNMK